MTTPKMYALKITVKWITLEMGYALLRLVASLSVRQKLRQKPESGQNFSSLGPKDMKDKKNILG